MSDFLVFSSTPGGHKARCYDRVDNRLGRGEVYPRPHRGHNFSNLRIGIAQLRSELSLVDGDVKYYGFNTGILTRRLSGDEAEKKIFVCKGQRYKISR